MKNIRVEYRPVVIDVDPESEVIVVPDGVYAIQNHAFDSESSAKVLILPKSLRQVEPYALLGSGIQKFVYTGNRLEFSRVSGLIQAALYAPADRIDGIDFSIQNHGIFKFDEDGQGIVEEINPTLGLIRIQKGCQYFGNDCFSLPGICTYYMQPALTDLFLPESFKCIRMENFNSMPKLKRIHSPLSKEAWLKSPLHLDCTKYYRGFVSLEREPGKTELLLYKDGKVIDKKDGKVIDKSVEGETYEE